VSPANNEDRIVARNIRGVNLSGRESWRENHQIARGKAVGSSVYIYIFFLFFFFFFFPFYFGMK